MDPEIFYDFVDDGVEKITKQHFITFLFGFCMASAAKRKRLTMREMEWIRRRTAVSHGEEEVEMNVVFLKYGRSKD